MKDVAMTALSVILAMFLTGSQGDPGPCQSPIQHGIYADGMDVYGNSAVIPVASRPEPVESGPMLLKSGDTADRTAPEPPLFIAPQAGNRSAVQLSLNCGADPNLATWSGETAMIDDTDSGTTEVFRLLLQRRAGPDARNREGVATLIKPAEQENLEIVQALVATGVHVSPCDRNGETALLTDAATGYQEAAGVLPVTGTENSVPSPYG
jgi:ankyrin repeat protein